MAPDSNDNIRVFLDYYTSLSNPEYAVLINGCWGSGKTWLIRKYFEIADPKREAHIYVSLYGARSTNDIEREFFVQLHPKLASKGMTIAARLAGGVVNFGTNAVLSSSLISEAAGATVQSCLTNTSGRTLLFDDLERCSMPLRDVLGYINYFVEHGGYRCIILANEAEIPSSLEDGHKYKDIKEKLIGQTLTVVADFDAATNHFANLITSDFARALIKKHLSTAREIFQASETNNLRVLRHALFDFARIADVLDKQHASNDDIVRTLFAQHLAYAIEVRSGRITVPELANVKKEELERIYKKILPPSDEPDEPTPTPTRVARYTSAVLDAPLVQDEFWMSMYQSGTIDSTILNASIAESSFYYDAKTPSWKRLIDLWSLSNEEFECFLSDVRRKFDRREYGEIGIVKHISGILMFLAKGRVIDDTVQDVLEQSKRYVDTMVDSGALATNADDFGRIYNDDHYAHTQFWSIDIPEFAELRKYIVAATAEAIAKTMPQAGADLLEEMRSDVYLFFRRLILSNSADNRYYDKPILAHISPEEFVDALLNLHRSGWPTVTRALRERYDHIEFARSLASELPWLGAIRRILGLRLDGLAGTLDEFRIRKLMEYLEESMTKLGKALPPEPGE